MNYRLTLYGTNMYKEVHIADNLKTLSIGTDKECQLRFAKDHFATLFRIDIEHRDDKYIMFCDSNIYFKTKDSIGERTHFLEVGDQVAVCHGETDATFFYLDFSIDFGNIQDNYNYKIQIPVGYQFTIGDNSGCHIQINGKNMNGDYVTAFVDGNGLLVDTSNARYGVSVNGFLIRSGQVRLLENQFLSIYGQIFYYEQGYLYTSDDGSVSTSFNSEQIKLQNNSFKYPCFVRNPRQQFVMPNEKIPVLPPKAAPQEEKNDLLITILPMIVTMSVMIAVRSMMGSNGMYMIYFGVSMGMSVIMSIVNYFRGKKERKKQAKLRIINYDKYIDLKEEEVQHIRDEEKFVADKMNVSVQETLNLIGNFDARLFEKEKDHKDFLDVWVGTGTVEANCQIEFTKQEYVETEDVLMNYPEQMHDKYKYLENMPIVLHLAHVNAIGVVGDRNKLYQFLKNMIVTIAGQHFYQDVKFFLMLNEEDVNWFGWARWFQNAADDSFSSRYFIYDDESKKRGLQFLYSELNNRKTVEKGNNRTHYVVFVYRTDVLGGHPVTNFVEEARNLGFTFVFFDEHVEKIHHAVDQMVYLEAEENKGVIRDINDGEKTQEFYYPHVSSQDVSKAALKLACVYVDEISLESTLTKNISLYELFGIMTAYDLDLNQRWSEAQVWKSMAAPIGVLGSGETLSLDIHETAHGPHGLVAGTTGSGKSELLQTFILSLATRFNPHEVAFVLIDFKGGGMANQFRDLPHLNGAITNIDGKQIDRSLMSIRAELLKRQELFAEFGVNRIDDYIKLQREGKTKVYLPHLILIVDEFAELKTDQPEFMKELISTARIGRSLGVHLILATQKPSGVVNDQIWSNSRFKLCLKVQDKSDSNEVIKSPLAAEIKEPGRAYLQVGNNEIFELFQSAYSGAPALVAGVDEGKAFKISKVGLSGSRQVIYEQKKDEQTENETQMDALVHYIHEYCEKNHIEKLPDICLPPLPEKLPYTLEGFVNGSTDIVVPLGIYDNPERQQQNLFSMSVTDGNTIAIGSTQTGKTNFLQLIIRSLAEMYTPNDVKIYILDFASTILKNFKDLKHVSAVVTATDDERLKNVMRILSEEIAKRKKVFSEMGLSSYSAYRESGQTEYPQIVVMMDNFISFKALFPDFMDAMQEIIREGPSMGVCFIITSTQGSGIGQKILSYIDRRLAFTCNESTDYGYVFDRCRLKPDEYAGRCIIKIEKAYYECQQYLSFDAEREIDKISEIKEFIAAINEKYSDYVDDKILEIPKEFRLEFAMKILARELVRYELLLGLNFSNVKPVISNMIEKNCLFVTGPKHSGKYNFLQYLIRVFDARAEAELFQMYIMDNVERRFEYASSLPVVKKYTTIADDFNAEITAIGKELDERYKLLAEGKSEELDNRPMLIIMLNSNDYYEMINANKEVLNIYKLILTKYKVLKAFMLFTDASNLLSFVGLPEVIKAGKESKHYMVFEDINTQKIFEIPPTVARKFKKKLLPGEAYYFNNAALMKMKTPFIGEFSDND
ncbi:type VII secretion protein EssC [Butyrivibrio sp. INlla14]|uniref:type VII secretion protein EssC n=1 Tax=Butyrivibrio sp. INlla14 TaxID=1520808 RepID=UPI00087682C5|nr:type VII secretion protein EssC [Butyrivibrio sp. INlla14]SCY47275.1 DNA segregation ATPase FtsK/SpoIIIE, S-DNA-T family [Butyrivibrio sp. INlla14]